VRRWVPELAKMPSRYIHNPWEAPEAVLRAACVRLDESYPCPVVDHRFARERFLAVAAQHLKQDARVRLASKTDRSLRGG
jgi:deoxyribodipyrimidine photo-lyase